MVHMHNIMPLNLIIDSLHVPMNASACACLGFFKCLFTRDTCNPSARDPKEQQNCQSENGGTQSIMCDLVPELTLPVSE